MSAVDQNPNEDKNDEEKKNDDNVDVMKSPFNSMIRNVLNCSESMKDGMHDFYINKIGMVEIEKSDNKIIYGFQHNKQDSFLEIRYKKEFKKSDSNQINAYWKIGIVTPDVDTTRNSLISNNINVSKPGQFQDIGYLCHLSDPSGFNIELLQHTFKSNFDKNKIKNIMDKNKYILGSNEVSIGQITLRVSNIEQSLIFYSKIMGMKYLSKQPVNNYGFTLYFLGYTNDENQVMPKQNDLESVENREWLWQRPYTTLELQHKWKNKDNIKYKICKQDEIGWQGIVFQSKLNIENTQKYLKQCGVDTQLTNQSLLKCYDPDQYPLFIQCQKKT